MPIANYFAVCPKSNFKDDIEVINLPSDYDLRTVRYRAQKSRFNSEIADFKSPELEHLIAFWRCAKGKGVAFPFVNRTDDDNYLMVRFDSNELNLTIRGDGQFEFSNLSLVEVFEELPASLRFATNPNVSVQETVFQLGNGNFPSQFVSLVDTTPTVDSNDNGGNGGGSGNSLASQLSNIIAISEVQGRLVLFGFKLGSPSKYRILIETQPGNINFFIAGEIDSLDTDFLPNHFINISDTKKGIVFTTETTEDLPEDVEEGLVFYALTIDEFGIFEKDFQVIENYLNFYRHYSSRDIEVFVSSSGSGCFSWSTLGMNIKSCFTYSGTDYKILNGSTQSGTEELTHLILDDELIYIGKGFEVSDTGETLENDLYRRSILTQSWIAQVDGNYNAYDAGIPININDQENIANILYLDESTYVRDFDLSVPGPFIDAPVVDYLGGYNTGLSILAILENPSEILALRFQSSLDGDLNPISTVELVILEIDGNENIVEISNYEIIENYLGNLDEGEAKPQTLGSYHKLSFTECKL